MKIDTSTTHSRSRTTTHTVSYVGHNKDAIAQRIAQANALRDPAKQIQSFEKILSDPLTENLLSRYDVGNVHWNKAIAHTQESDHYFNDAQQPVTAIRHHEQAIHHMQYALSCYDCAGDRDQTKALLDEFQEKRDKILDHLQNLVVLPEVGSFQPNRESPREQKMHFYRLETGAWESRAVDSLIRQRESE